DVSLIADTDLLLLKQSWVKIPKNEETDRVEFDTREVLLCGFDQSGFTSVEGQGSVNFRNIPFNDDEVGNAYLGCASEVFSLVKDRIRDGNPGGCLIQVVFPNKGDTVLLNGL